jgi:hypothetical protein
VDQLAGDVVDQLGGCGGSVGWGCGGSVEGMWWLSWGDVVAQLAKATGRHQTEEAVVPGSNPAPQHSPERGPDI